MSQQHLGLSKYQRSLPLFSVVHWIAMFMKNIIYLVVGISGGYLLRTYLTLAKCF